jgi:hypothetical protein
MISRISRGPRHPIAHMRSKSAISGLILSDSVQRLCLRQVGEF